MVNLTPLRNLCFCAPGSYCYQSVTLGKKCWQSHSLNSIRNVPEVLTVFQLMPTLYRDDENFGKSTTIFIHIYKNSSHPESKETFLVKIVGVFWGKFCVSVLFNNYFPFSIKIPVKYNTVLLLVSKVAEIPWFRKDLKNVFFLNQHCWNLILKCITIQIQKALKNDR